MPNNLWRNTKHKGHSRGLANFSAGGFFVMGGWESSVLAASFDCASLFSFFWGVLSGAASAQGAVAYGPMRFPLRFPVGNVGRYSVEGRKSKVEGRIEAGDWEQETASGRRRGAALPFSSFWGGKLW